MRYAFAFCLRIHSRICCSSTVSGTAPMLDQRRGRQIPEDLGASFDALSVKPAMRDPVRHVRKPFLYKTKRRRPVIGLPPHTYALLEGLYARKSCGVKTD